MFSADPLAHHFQTIEQQRTAASLGMWVFLASEVLFFGALFCGYAVYRLLYADAFAAASRHLDVRLGTLNTAVLLTSSLTMAFAVHSRELQLRSVTGWLVATLVLGSVFLGIKAVEYTHKWHEHLVPGSDFQWSAAGPESGHAELFFGFYFAMTGLHAVHMVVGIGLLAWLVARCRSTRIDPPSVLVENCGLYWHLVDIVWVYLFPLLYLIDRTGGLR